MSANWLDKVADHPSNSAALTAPVAALYLSPRIATDDREHLARDITGAGGRSEEHEGGCDFFRLGGSLHRCIAAEFGDLLGRFIGRVERRPDRSGRHRIDADAAFNEMRGKRTSEGVDAPFCHRVVEQSLVAEQSGDGAGHDDGAAIAHMRYGGSRHIEISIEIGLDGPIKMLVSQLFEAVDVLLECGVVDQDVEPAELIHRPLHRVVAEFWIGDV